MNTYRVNGLVRVMRVPLGDAPIEIRAAWVGLMLRCYPVSGMMSGPELDIVTGRQLCGPRNVVVVPQAEALEVLGKYQPEAAQWWKERGFPQERPFPRPCFYFGEEEVSLFDGVEQRTIIDFDDFMNIAA